MTFGKIAAAGAISAIVLSASPASAHCWRRCDPVVGVLTLPFDIVAGAVTIATAPLVIVGDALSGGYVPPPPHPYYGYSGYGYPPGAYAHYGYARPAYYNGPHGRYYYGPRHFYRPHYYRY